VGSGIAQAIIEPIVAPADVIYEVPGYDLIVRGIGVVRVHALRYSGVEAGFDGVMDTWLEWAPGNSGHITIPRAVERYAVVNIIAGIRHTPRIGCLILQVVSIG